MKALTIRQPWASLIAVGAKTIETRSWPTKYRGRLAIHAGMHAPHDGVSVGGWSVYRQADAVRALDRSGAWHPLPLGAIVATARLVDCVPVVDGLSINGGGWPAVRDRGRALMYRSHEAFGGDLDGLFLCRWSGPARGGIVDSCHEDQLPFGDFTPGRWAWLLDDIKPTTERCPACWGDGGFKEDSMVLYGIPGGEDWSDPCPVCNPGGRRTEPLGVGAYGCDPMPARGKQGLWTWALAGGDGREQDG